MLRATLLFCLLGTPVFAADFSSKISGHTVAIAATDEGERLTVDGREMLKDIYVSIDEVGVVGGTPVAVGTASAGGNACEGTPFVLAFPPDGDPRLDGPLETCDGIGVTLETDRIDLSSEAIPGRDGQHWTWTADAGFAEVGTTAFTPDQSKGWAQLRDRSATHPSDLMSYGEIAEQIDSLAGSDIDVLQRIFTGPGTVSFEGNWFFGEACTAHYCGSEEAIIAASLNDRRIFLAWKPDGKKIIVRPPVKEWADQPRAKLRAWAKKWK